MPETKYDAIIVGAGISGLSCALALKDAGLSCLLLEASDRVGGRVQTDEIDGYTLDRGFQIFLTAYPEARAILDYSRLDFKKFEPGALVRYKGKFHKLSDPWQNPSQALSTMMAPIGTPADKVRIASVRTRTGMMSLEEINKQEEKPTLYRLKELGFTDKMVDRFLRPFLSGIFLENKLNTTCRFFDFVFSMLAHGDNVLPAGGMKAIPEQMASNLPTDSIKLNCKVQGIEGGVVKTEKGEEFKCNKVVLATEESVTRKLLGIKGEAKFNAQNTIYFATDRAPYKEPMILLNAEPDGFITNVSVQSNVAPSYAPAGKALVGVSVVDCEIPDSSLEEKAREELASWFGKEVQSWKFLKSYRVKYSLPDQSPEANEERAAWVKEVDSVILAGDYLENGSINGAMAAGRKSADKILESVAVSR